MFLRHVLDKKWFVWRRQEGVPHGQLFCACLRGVLQSIVTWCNAVSRSLSGHSGTPTPPPTAQSPSSPCYRHAHPHPSTPAHAPPPFATDIHALNRLIGGAAAPSSLPP